MANFLLVINGTNKFYIYIYISFALEILHCSRKEAREGGEERALMWLWVLGSQTEHLHWGVESKGIGGLLGEVTLELCHYKFKGKETNPSHSSVRWPT